MRSKSIAMSWFNEHGVKLSDTITNASPGPRLSLPEGLLATIRWFQMTWVPRECAATIAARDETKP
jgi:hypothetical protein